MDLSEVSYRPAMSRGCRMHMPPHPIAAKQARTLTEFVLRSWGLFALMNSAALVACELTTNALKRHDVFEFAIYRDGDMALIEVTDSSLGVPRIEEADDTATGGRGLLMVRAYSEQWGVRCETDGRKTVWARISK